MYRLVKYGLAPGLLILGLGVSANAAPIGKPVSPEALGLGSAATPAAMCGYTCRRGGRYVPGPPEVCYERGMEYCGSSRGAPPRPVYRSWDDGYGRRRQIEPGVGIELRVR